MSLQVVGVEFQVTKVEVKGKYQTPDKNKPINNNIKISLNFQNAEKDVTLWIVASIAVGVIIITLLICLLCKLGFFKKKEAPIPAEEMQDLNSGTQF